MKRRRKEDEEEEKGGIDCPDQSTANCAKLRKGNKFLTEFLYLGSWNYINRKREKRKEKRENDDNKLISRY